jgi:hypothetical protein
MRKALLDQLDVETEPVSRGELGIALVTVSAILIAFLILGFASHTRAEDAETIAPRTELA